MPHLSELQKYILTTCILARSSRRIRKDTLIEYYHGKRNVPSTSEQQGTVTKSIERLVTRGLLSVQGRKTSKKMFIRDIRLTPLGRKRARALLGEQQRLPFNGK